eukprot:552274_1
MSAQIASWKCISCGLCNAYSRNKCQACFVDKAMKLLLSEHNQLLVDGFIRNIQSLFSINQIIPTAVIEICTIYYVIRIVVFQYDRYQRSNINLIDPHQKFVKTLIINKPIPSNVRIMQSCYVPNMSSMMTINDFNLDRNKCYDGIVGLCINEDTVQVQGGCFEYAYISLFESTKITNNENIIDYHSFQSQYPIAERPNGTTPQLLNCDVAKNGVIYGFNGNLYQLETNMIDNLNNFNFTKIETLNNHPFKLNEVSSITLSIGYLPYDNTLFAIENIRRSRVSNCGVFNFDSNKWDTINCYDQGTYSGYGYFRPSVNYNNIYDSNNVYIVSQQGLTIPEKLVTAKMDLNKNVWSILNIDHKLAAYGTVICWFDNNPHILFYGNNECFAYLDIRDNKHQWTINRINDRDSMNTFNILPLFL